MTTDGDSELVEDKECELAIAETQPMMVERPNL